MVEADEAVQGSESSATGPAYRAGEGVGAAGGAAGAVVELVPLLTMSAPGTPM